MGTRRLESPYFVSYKDGRQRLGEPSPGSVGGIAQHGFHDYPAHLGAGDLDARRRIEHAAGAQAAQGLQADQHGPRACEAQADLPARQRVRVFPAGGEMLLRAVQPAVIHRSQTWLASWIEQVGGREAAGRKFGSGQVAAAGAQIFWQVAEDVHELQAFAEADAIRQQPRPSSRTSGKRCARHIFVQNSPTQPATR